MNHSIRSLRGHIGSYTAGSGVPSRVKRLLGLRAAARSMAIGR
jgi:hypothetical protein